MARVRSKSLELVSAPALAMMPVASGTFVRCRMATVGSTCNNNGIVAFSFTAAVGGKIGGAKIDSQHPQGVKSSSSACDQFQEGTLTDTLERIIHIINIPKIP